MNEAILKARHKFRTAIKSNKPSSKTKSYEVKCVKGPLSQPAQYIDKANIATISGKQLIFTSPYIQRSEIFTPKVYGITSFCTDDDDIFAVAEWNENPSIFVYKYPFFQIIITLKGGAEMEYKSLTISPGAQFLAGLSGVPDHTLFLWRISSGYLVAQMEIGYSSIAYLSFPKMGAFRLALSTETKVYVIEIDETEEGITLTKRPVKLNNVVHHCWESNDDILCSVEHNIWRVDSTALTFKQLHIYGDILTDQKIVSFEIVNHHLILCLEDGKIVRLEKRNMKDEWKAKIIADLKCTSMGFSVSPEKNYLVHTSCHSKVTIVHIDSGSKSKLSGYEVDVYTVTDACVLQPANDHLVSAHATSSVFVWKMDATCRLVSHMNVGREITCLSAAPDGPRCYIGTVDGHFVVVDLYSPGSVRIVWITRLSRAAINHISTARDGSLTAAQCGNNDIFVLETVPTKGFAIKTKLSTDGQIFQMLCSVLNNTNMVCCLTQTPNMRKSYLTLFIFGADHIDRVDYGLDAFYKCFCLNDGTSTLTVITPEHRSINTISLTDPQFLLTNQVSGLARNIIKQEQSVHEMEVVGVFELTGAIVTAAKDGKVISKTTTPRTDNSAKQHSSKPIITQTHQAQQYGVKKLVLTENSELGIAIGNDGTLVVFKLPQGSEQSTLMREANFDSKQQEDDQVVRNMPSISEQLVEVSQATWEEAQAENTWKQNEDVLIYQQNDLKNSLKELGLQLTEMLDENKQMDELDKLPIAEFELDVEEQIKFESSVNKEVAKIRNEMLDEMATNICKRNRLKSMYWDSMTVKGKSVTGFLSGVEVYNYPITNKDQSVSDLLEGVHFRRELEVYENSVVEELLRTSEQIQPLKSTDQHLLKNMIKEYSEECPSSDSQTLGVRMVWGMDQLQVSTRKQRVDMIYLLNEVIHKLKNCFNTTFDQIFAAKEAELRKIETHNQRLVHIYRELGSEKQPWKPVLSGDETPEQYFIVNNDDITTKRYICPAEIARQEKQALEEENNRLQKIQSNEFRERAIMKMMDGVLEVTWEDKLKKDIPRPEFMEYKLPEEWSIDEVALVDEYKAKCLELEQNRQSYKRILQREETKILSILEDLVTNFDDKIKSLQNLKIETESAITQEELKVCRLTHEIAQADIRCTETDKITQEIDQLQLRTSSIQSSAAHLKQLFESYKIQQEPFGQNQKQLERLFKKDFSALPSNIFEVLFEAFKYRPPDFVKMIQLFEKHRSSIISNTAEVHKNKTKPKLATNKDNKQSPATPGPPNVKRKDPPANTAKLTNNKTTKAMSSPLKNKDTEIKTENDQPTVTNNKHNNSTSAVFCLMSKEKLTELINAADNETNRPDAVESQLWLKMCIVRREVIFNEYSSVHKAQMMANISSAVEKRQKWEHALNARLRSLLARSVDLKQVHDNIHQDPEVQIILKLGQVEVDLGDFCPDFSDAILLPKVKVEDFNKQIKNAGQKKIDVMRDAMKFRSGIIMQNWLAQKWQMTIEDLEQKLKDITFMKLTRKLQQFLRDGQDPDKLEIVKLEKRLDCLEEVAEKQRHEDSDIEIILKRLKKSKENENHRLELEAQHLQLDASEREILFDVQCNRKKTSQIKEKLSSLRKLSQMSAMARNQQLYLTHLHEELRKNQQKKIPIFYIAKND